jgi:hypothetical protein
MSEVEPNTEVTKEDAVEVNPEVLSTLLKAAQDRNNLGSDHPWGDTEETEAAIEQAQELLSTHGEGTEEFRYITDERQETYGYGVYNTHENCFVPLPASLATGQGVATPDHLTNEETETLINRVAKEHGLDRVEHLRVVKVTLDNDLDKKAVEHHDEYSN